MVAVRVADLVAVAGPGGSDVLVPTAAAAVRDGDLMAWCSVVAVAPAVCDPDGGLAADGWLPDHVRLGVLEQHLGDGVIEQVVASTVPAPTRPGRRRLMSLPLVARLVLAMTLLPHASYVEALAQVVGVLLRLPWARDWHLPGSKVITKWRRRLGPDAMRELFWRVAGPLVPATAPGGCWHGLRVGAIDGTLVKVPDSTANRAAFASAGTSDDSAPFPQVRLLMATARAGRAIVAAAFDASSVGEQTLTTGLVHDHPDVLAAPGWVWLVDRNYLGFELIEAIYRGGCGAHLVMRIKDGIRLPVLKRLSQHSYLSRIYSRDRKRHVPVRVIEYDVTLTDADRADGKTGKVSEVFCLATTLLDADAYPDRDIADLYPQRWSAAETSIGECKKSITDAGPSRGPILRSEEPGLVRQELWAWLTAVQLLRAAAHAATTATTGVGTDQISFTTVRREATRSMTQSLVTATTPPEALAAVAEHADRRVLANLVVTDRQRHSPRRQKHKPRFPHTATTKPTTKGRRTINMGKAPDPSDTS